MTQLRAMKEGEVIAFPLAKFKQSYLRHVCSFNALDWGMTFTANLNREEQALIVTRTK